MVFREEEITKEILLQEFKKFESENVKDDPRIRYCDYCEKPKTILLEIIRKNYMGIETEDLVRFEIDSKKHNSCYKIAKYEKLSIFDKLHKKNTFENSEPKNDLEKLYLESFKKYCDNFEKAKEIGVGLLLTGNAGTGKTFYSNCISNELKSKGFTVLSFNISGYMQELKKEFKEEQLLESIKSVDLVIIDDVGSEVLSEFTKEKMFNLFNTIYLDKKPCIVTTNNNAKELEEHFKINGSGKILDRLLELCKPFKFDWKSRRQEIGQEKFKDLF